MAGDAKQHGEQTVVLRDCVGVTKSMLSWNSDKIYNSEDLYTGSLY